MDAREIADWQAYLRRRPAGFEWENFIQATLSREIFRLLPTDKKRLPPLDTFLWKPPAPLFVTTEKKKAKALQAAKALKPTKYKGTKRR
jgi:hypothetical protein